MSPLMNYSGITETGKPRFRRLLIKLADALFFLGWQKNGATETAKDEAPYICDDIETNLKNVYWQEALHFSASFPA
ncbi:MAG: hypothetical protein PUC30_08035 [Lachnospiraceae bacterium]|nr:hypothetical protein [Lachnospiraceae bacterium]